MFEEFLADYKRREKKKTAETYKKLLSQFEKWLDNQGSQEKFKREDVLSFLKTQHSWSNSSKNVFLSALSSWARSELEKVQPAVTDQEKLEVRRLKRIKGIRSYEARPKEKEALNLDQIVDLRIAMDQDTQNLFWVLLWFGIRVGELKKIKKIGLEDRSLTVETLKRKGSEAERTLYFDDYTGRILQHSRDKGLLDLPYQTIYKRFKKASKLTSIKLTPHVCRHTFATHMSSRTDPFTLAQMLGHSITGVAQARGGAKVTGDYVHPAQERIRKVMLERHYLIPLEVK
ncbi:hypothetical protein AKJ58_00980 [candidate division MSBL1 archaeon SCGC-AAA385D11]|uniref:Tyr recombinase domain-containing protein n=1 Tax=candidate division MSBL1 archaeon SCGC-AAA385D11 TaxID=1698286 RepID=A0A133VNN6_9EURY|nr:hypothetical protein AKJ58_00980 [candidate division MSBL1 archaeon SCGC-AAA385D11]